MSNVKVYRQGDVCLVPVNEIPAKVRKMKTRLLRKGENGGLHSLAKGSDAEILFSTTNKTKYVDARTNTHIVHGEHAEVVVPPGKYEVRIQREWTGGSARVVGD